MKIQTISDVPDSTYFTMSDVEPVYRKIGAKAPSFSCGDEAPVGLLSKT